MNSPRLRVILAKYEDSLMYMYWFLLISFFMLLSVFLNPYDLKFPIGLCADVFFFRPTVCPFYRAAFAHLFCVETPSAVDISTINLYHSALLSLAKTFVHGCNVNINKRK